MAISSTQSYVEYTGDSSTTSFTIPFYFLLNSDISAMVADADGSITELTNGTDFTVTGQGVSTGGTCVLNTAYSNSYSILIYREPPETQETKYYENGKFPAKSHESALDKLTMLIQRFGWMWDSLALKRPNYFADYFEANGHRIADLQDPKNAQDATTKKYVDTGLSSEATEREIADDMIRKSLAAEIQARKLGDTDLANNIKSLRGDLVTESTIRAAGDKTTLSLAESYANTLLAGNISINGGTNVGFWLPDAVAIFDITVSYFLIQVRGFYQAGDGGAGLWRATGNFDSSKARSHIPSKALIYDASGREYQLVIDNIEINAAANGLKSYTQDEAVADVAAADTVCAGEVINGITSLIDAKFAWEGMPGTSIRVLPSTYRISKEHIKTADSTNFHFEESWFYVFAANEYKYSVTGKRLDGFGHTVADIEADYEAAGGTGEDWGLVSARNINVYGGHFIGDQVLDKTMDNYTAGCGIIVLNPEYVLFHGTTAQHFIWPCVVTKAEYQATDWAADGDFDVEGTDYNYIVPFMTTAGTRWGNFYGANFENCRFTSGIRGSFRSNVDWSRFDGGIITTDWVLSGDGANASGQVPSYFAVVTGTGFHCSGAYISSNGGIGAYYSNPSKGIVFTSAKGHVFSGIYTEWTIRNFVIDKWIYSNASNSRSMGLHIQSVTQYKENASTMGIVEFQDGCFGHYDDNDTWVSASNFSGSTPTPQGTTELVVGSPVRDMGAFHHGGYNFKYGTYNIINDGDNPDFEFVRDTKTAKEMFNSYGVISKNTDWIFPTKEMGQRSMVCIWIKDLTGNFDPTNFALYLNAAQETQAVNANDFLSYGELQVDYGNGYKMIMLSNRREYPNDGRSSWDPQIGLRLQNTSGDTPILLKAIEAYNGGFPLFPQGCDYIPSADTNSGDIFGVAPGFENGGAGGGIFFAGDIVNPWSGTKFGLDYDTRTLSDNYDALPAIVEGGFNLPSRMQASFTATVTAVDSTNSTTTVSVPSTYSAGIAQGIPLHIVSGGSATGDTKILKRVANSDGTLTSDYVLNGVVGAVGDSLAIDQSKVTALTLRRDIKVNNATAEEKITSPEIEATTEINASGGYVHLGRGRTDAHTDHLEFHPSGNYEADAEITAYKNGDNAQINYIADTHSYSGTVVPSATATDNLGASNATWNNLFVQNDVTVISDQYLKSNITPIADNLDASSPLITKALLTNILNIPFQMWQLNSAISSKGTDARYHAGVIAQDIVKAFTDAGLDWTKYAVVTKDSHSQVVTKDASGNYTPVLDSDSDGKLISSSSIPLSASGYIEVVDGRDTVTTDSSGVITITRVTYMVRMSEFYALRLAALENKMGLYSSTTASS
ncbi:tail fiber domain-containing protein [Tatumella saanichensis]|uniref:tail fiber domain-containing protein n=1 Tax=Tatumella saanichensis TaxID=480813 RepID=UPI0004A3F9F3|nr:tail fiber domain-containing protein [Tatumella saanichensis]